MKKAVKILSCLILIAVLLSFGYYTVLKRIYRIEYSEEVKKWSDEYDVEPSAIYAIIKCESDFKYDAVSSIGAVGLMQITEETFDWIKYKLNDSDSTYDDMYDPDLNIKYGTYLISYHLKRYESIENALCAYHAGMGALESWLNNEEYSKDGKTLSKIPYADTSHYVKTVLKTQKNYIRLYYKH